MLSIFKKIAEQRIKEAQERGDFDDLPGKGQPLEWSEWDNVPEESRLAYKILKNAGYSPPEVEIKKEIVQIEDLLAFAKDEKEKYRQIKKLNFLITKLNIMRPTSIQFEKNQIYYDKIVDRTTVSPDKKDEEKS
ncbi:MAG: DUF1992 domain-containing protein [Deltaproteobacteria bacterium]|nr:DUF1992 domain-containing protein [Deltaproteobacteria bacterium]MBW2052316.1 DUF1992 domain-containing protein [Deltaproteobacteria bacterium]MBW2142269.1 DUF1992 domain-containing protein [Deltaproteobacteria bacterium]MBW2323020.1 DUF1992 domain-containing protein [Deltaproteobacteria bacterium]